jgi:hypothetical protein
MRATSRRAALVLAGMIFLARSVGAQEHKREYAGDDPGKQSQGAPATPQFKQIPGAPEGAQEARLFTHSLPQIHSRLEIRTILVPAGKPVTFVAENEGIFELRTGAVATVSEGKTAKRQRGEIWQAAKGSRITLEASGELAVVRAIYLVADEK